MRIVTQLLLALTLFTAITAKAQQAESSKTGELEWHTEILKANEISKAQHKPIFAFFTGSDWCGWCRKLQMEVFQKPEFISWAKKNVVLLELDFPRAKTLPQELVQQNSSLQQAFQVRGYPTVWMFYMAKGADSASFAIQPLGSLGYPAGAEKGKEEVKFLSEANALLAKASDNIKK